MEGGTDGNRRPAGPLSKVLSLELGKAVPHFFLCIRRQLEGGGST